MTDNFEDREALFTGKEMNRFCEHLEKLRTDHFYAMQPHDFIVMVHHTIVALMEVNGIEIGEAKTGIVSEA